MQAGHKSGINLDNLRVALLSRKICYRRLIVCAAEGGGGSIVR